MLMRLIKSAKLLRLVFSVDCVSFMSHELSGDIAGHYIIIFLVILFVLYAGSKS